MDIVERLRDGQICRWQGICRDMSVVGGCTCAEAADEIERLREALKLVRDELDRRRKNAEKARP